MVQMASCSRGTCAQWHLSGDAFSVEHADGQDITAQMELAQAMQFLLISFVPPPLSRGRASAPQSLQLSAQRKISQRIISRKQRVEHGKASR